MSSPKSEETFSIAQPDKEIIKAKMDRLHTEPNMDKEEINLRKTKILNS